MMYNIILLTLLLFSFRVHGYMIWFFNKIVIIVIIEIVLKNKIVLGYAKKFIKKYLNILDIRYFR